MYHSVIPVQSNHDPIVVEGKLQTRILLFNAGPATIKARVWNEWDGRINDSYSSSQADPNLNLELRPGDQRVVSGAMIRLSINRSQNPNNSVFAAVGARILNDLYYDIE